jgi:hypothetical protein
VTKKGLALSAVLLVFLSSLTFLSCKKINEATELGGDLIPAVDNINTFELSLETETDNALLNDSIILLHKDQVAIGSLNDPEFGKTEAAGYFNISSGVYSKHPFINKDAVTIDSVVLSLGYTGSYGDSLSTQSLQVFKISPTATLNDTSFYHYTDNEFPTTGTELGSTSFNISLLKDSITVVDNRVAQKVANVVRIRLNNSLGTLLASYDTSNSANGGYYNDSIFKTLFKGIAVKAGASGNALTYFDVFDTTKSKLMVYFRATKDGKTDTATANFYHLPVNYINGTHPAGVANIVKRTPGGNWDSYLANADPNDDKLYIQSSPGSYCKIKIPGLDNMANKVVHLAELIAYKLPSAQENIFTAPPLLYLDKVNNTNDTAFLFESDQAVNSAGEVNYLGGNLKADNTFRFNITRHVQGILTRKEPNLKLRLYAPFRTELANKNTSPIQFTSVAASDRIANGRVVVAGGNYSDPNMRLRLRIVYSNL